MKEIARKVWYEPAVAIGLLVTLALLVVNIVGESHWDLQTIIYIISPLLAALGIRPLVKPTAKIDDENAEAARRKLQPR